MAQKDNTDMNTTFQPVEMEKGEGKGLNIGGGNLGMGDIGEAMPKDTAMLSAAVGGNPGIEQDAQQGGQEDMVKTLAKRGAEAYFGLPPGSADAAEDAYKQFKR